MPLDQLKDRVTEVAKVLLEKNPVALKATKDAVRRVGEMTYDDAEDYLVRAQEAANSYDTDGPQGGHPPVHRREELQARPRRLRQEPRPPPDDGARRKPCDWIAPDPVALHARGRPSKLACVDLATGRRWTYAELDAAIERGVAALPARSASARATGSRCWRATAPTS